MKNRFTRKLSACVLMTLCLAGLLPQRASAWSNEGHRIVARIAARHLSIRTKAAVFKLLSLDTNDPEKCMANKILEDQMACVSTWADTVKRDPKFRNTVSQHFVSIPVYVKEAERHYDPRRDCPNNDCIVAAIKLYKDVLLSPKETDLNRALALKFLIHLVGDLHQPLHVATDQDIYPDGSGNNTYKTDFGGNQKFVKWFGTSADPFGCLNLHSVWDEKIIEGKKLDDRAYANALDAQLSVADSAAFQKGDVIDWVNESYGLAITYAYGALPQPSVEQFCGTPSGAIQYCSEFTSLKGCAVVVKRNRYSLSTTYYNKTLPVVDKQLSRAGIRLARLLDEVFDPASLRGQMEFRKPRR